MNSWGIPAWLEDEVRNRDKTCVYCAVEMVEKMPLGGSRKNVATWEHIINDESIVTRENIARCCVSCNSSKGNRKLSVWIESSYCKSRGINSDSVADIIKTALRAEVQSK
ncbi:MAG: HNH endonuclease [Gammaproteobacteria bacterium]|nr:HNH endonuclease [Gammaproteobacteria bacterium]